MYQCDICKKEFTLKTNVNKHNMKNVHNFTVTPNIIKEANYKCSECELIFVVKSSLNRHRRIKHKINTTKEFQIKK